MVSEIIPIQLSSFSIPNILHPKQENRPSFVIAHLKMPRPPLQTSRYEYKKSFEVYHGAFFSQRFGNPMYYCKEVLVVDGILNHKLSTQK